MLRWIRPLLASVASSSKVMSEIAKPSPFLRVSSMAVLPNGKRVEKSAQKLREQSTRTQQILMCLLSLLSQGKRGLYLRRQAARAKRRPLTSLSLLRAKGAKRARHHKSHTETLHFASKRTEDPTGPILNKCAKNLDATFAC